MCRITTFKLKLISLLKTIFFLKTNLNSVLRAKNFGNSTLFIWNHNSTFFCEPVWVHDNVVVTICTKPKWGAEMNLLRRNLPCKIEGKTERTRNRGRKSFLGGKDCHQRGESNPTMAPPCETTTWQGYKLVHVLWNGKAEKPNLQKYSALHPVL